MTKTRQRFTFPRELLLVEVARRCPACDGPARLGLTKEEALRYHGFECARCEVWSEDELTERDIPEWWDGLRADDLEASRGSVGVVKHEGDAF